MSAILRIAAPFTLWIAAFSAVYGLEGLICSRHGAGLTAGQGRAMLVGAWIVAVALQAGLLLALRRDGGDAVPAFVRRVSLTLGIAAVVATAWTLAPVMASSVCR